MLVLFDFLPVYLIVIMDIIKYLQAAFVNWDLTMFSVSKGIEPKVHSSSQSELLGQVSYVLSDKTGTLTQNNMVFRKMSVSGISYG